MDVSRRKNKMTRPHSNIVILSANTKEFLQKICSKDTASVDMTKYGFIKDSQVYSLKIYLRPLLQKLQNICGNAAVNMTAKEIAAKQLPIKVKENNTYLGKGDKYKAKPKRIVKKKKVISLE